MEQMVVVGAGALVVVGAGGRGLVVVGAGALVVVGAGGLGLVVAGGRGLVVVGDLAEPEPAVATTTRSEVSTTPTASRRI